MLNKIFPSGLFFLLLTFAFLSCNNSKKMVSTEPCLNYESVPDIPAEILGGFRTISKRLHYPEGALSQKIGGTVNLALFIDKSGNIDSVIVTRKVHPKLDKEAVRVAKTLRAVPAKKNGVIVCSRWPLPIVFTPPR